MANASSTTVEGEMVQYVGTGLIRQEDSDDLVQLEVDASEYNIKVAYANEDGTVFLQQVNYVIPVNGHAVVLQDDQGEFEQYIVDDMEEELPDTEQMEEINQPILYYTNHSEMFGENDENTIGSSIDDNFVEENSNGSVIQLSKQIKLEQGYIDSEDSVQGNSSIEDDVQVQDDTADEEVIVASEPDLGQLQQPQYQYAILKNGKLHLQTVGMVEPASDGQINFVEDDGQNQQFQEQLAAFQQSINLETSNVIDLEKITGKNLITGQTVTLDSYFDKLQKRLAVDVSSQCLTYNPKKRRRSESSQEQKSICGNSSGNSFINKKVVVGKTVNGKRIVGKILQIRPSKDKCESAETEDLETESRLQQTANVHLQDEDLEQPEGPVDSETSTAETQQPHYIIKKHVISRENFDYSIGKTLSGLMGLETVQRRLRDRNLVVKLIEKIYNHSTDGFNRTVSYVYGHMEYTNVTEETSGNRQWVFVLHSESNKAATEDNDVEDSCETSASDPLDIDEDTLGQSSEDDGKETQKSPDKTEGNRIDTNRIKDVSLEMEDTWTKYNRTASVTIITTVDKNGKKSTRVNLSPQQLDSRCRICNKEFKSVMQMRKHVSNVHDCDKCVKCELCGKYFANQNVLQRHRKIHTGERWYRCPKCSKSFNTAGSLKRHLTVHDPSLRPLECSVCVQRFTDESSLRKHLLIHTGIRAYACEICNKAFVNQGDLNFHRRIHDPVKQYSCEVCGREFSRHSNLMRHAEIHRGAGALFRCDLCGCSYSFISSLTRHIVQKHIGHQRKQ